MALPTQRADELFDRLPRGLRASAGFWRGRAASAGAALRPALIIRQRDVAATRLATVSTGLTRETRGVAARETARLDTKAARLRPMLMTVISARATARLGEAGRLLGSLGPEQVLKRGYALVLTPTGTPVATSARASAESRLTIRFADGDTAVTNARVPQERPI
jgi:exodeoxyribonuclease VII large subunit